jgi:hypothetical protein
VKYLRSRPEILVDLDWIRTRQLDLGKDITGELYRIIGSIKMEAVQSHDQHMLVEIAQWIIFMTINTLVWRPSGEERGGTRACEISNRTRNWARNINTETSNESFRVLFRFLALGIGGLHI